MIKIYDYNKVNKEDLFFRGSIPSDVHQVVSSIIHDVSVRGDAALFEYTEKFDKAKLSVLEVTKEEINFATEKADPEFIRVLKKAAENIRAFHINQLRQGFEIKKDGVIMGQKITPIESVGLYVPGGTAAYPSTVLMDSIPAKIAGCKNLIMVTPPRADGCVNEQILAAAAVAGVDRIFKVGGAQAIAALAYGTESIPKVDKIVGPGNAFVAEAKKQVFGMVAIDMVAGPSEILVVADEKSNPAFVAADMLSQAEHDKMATAVLVTNSASLAEKVSEEIENQLPKLLRCDIARQSIDNNGKIIVADSVLAAIDIANELAPEHLELCVDNPFDMLENVQNAGSVFLGRNCPEALGDYLAGPNHTLPTSGTARFSSPLSVDDFIKKTQYTYYSADALQKDAQDVALFAKKEGLTAHAKSATIRSELKVKN